MRRFAAAPRSQPPNAPAPESLFTVHVQGGGTISTGAKVALSTADAHYLTSVGKVMNANGTSVGPTQLFTFSY